jgi:hypothetical protein
MALDLEIQALLRTNQVKEINFSMRGILVTGHGFWELSHHFSDGVMRYRIRATVNPRIVGVHTNARYNADDDRIHLRSPTTLSTPRGRGSVVHECTHAQIDMRARPTPIRSEEGAAFIAQVWYLLACGENVFVNSSFPAELVTIVETLRQKSLRTSRPIQLSSDQINTVRRIMRDRYRYGTGHYTADGIHGFRYRGR